MATQKHEVLGYDAKGAPIYAYRENGIHKGLPCCGGKTKRGPCQAIARMQNGRCRVHNGGALKGTDHPSFRSGQYAKGFNNKANAQRLFEAVHDPKYMELGDEMALNAMEIMALTEQFNDGLDPASMQRIYFLGQEIEEILFSKQVNAFIDVMRDEGIPIRNLTNKIEEIVRITKNGCDQIELQKHIGSVVERRRKLVETEMKRVQIERNNMPADQVAHLFNAVAGVVVEVFAKDPVGLRAFAAKLDELMGANLPGANIALGGRPGVAGIVEPHSALGDRARNMADSIEVDGFDVED